MAEIDDSKLAQLNGAYTLLDRLLKDPKTRRDAERLVKVHKPDFPTTDDIAQPYVEKIDALSKKFDEYVELQRNSVQDREAEETFSRLRKSGYTEDGITKIKQIMKERTIPDVEAAAALFDKLNPPPPPAAPTPLNINSTWGMGENSNDEDTASLFKDPDGWAEREAIKAWNEN